MLRCHLNDEGSANRNEHNGYASHPALPYQQSLLSAHVIIAQGGDRIVRASPRPASPHARVPAQCERSRRAFAGRLVRSSSRRRPSSTCTRMRHQWVKARLFPRKKYHRTRRGFFAEQIRRQRQADELRSEPRTVSAGSSLGITVGLTGHDTYEIRKIRKYHTWNAMPYRESLGFPCLPPSPASSFDHLHYQCQFILLAHSSFHNGA